jgi:peptidyl-prolyl cis-trans isomerase C
MRDKYLELLNKAKASAKIEITDETLRKGYDQANKQPEPGSDPVAPAPQQ